VAASYRVVGQFRDIQVLGPTNVMDVQRIQFVTSPSAIYAEFPVPLSTAGKPGPLFTPAQVDILIGPLAESIENLIAGSAATTASYLQDVTDSGLLADYLDVVVEYDPADGFRPPMTTTVRIPLDAFLAAGGDPWFARLAASPQSLVDEAYQALAGTANL
jgi:hypothetical protein